MKIFVLDTTWRREMGPLPDGVEIVSDPRPDVEAVVRGKELERVRWEELARRSAILRSRSDGVRINELIIHVVQTSIEEGIPLVHRRHRTVPLTLLSSI